MTDPIPAPSREVQAPAVADSFLSLAETHAALDEAPHGGAANLLVPNIFA